MDKVRLFKYGSICETEDLACRPDRRGGVKLRENLVYTQIAPAWD